MKKLIVIGALLATILLTSCMDTATSERTRKDTLSNTQGGLWRNLLVYDRDNTVVAEYWGLFDLEFSEASRKIKFELNGERHIIVLADTDRVISSEVGEEAVREYWEKHNIAPHKFGSIVPKDYREGE